MIHLAKFKFPPNLEPQNVDQPVNTPASATGSNAASQALPDTKDRWQYLRVSLAVFVIAFAYLYRLDRPLLWIDEAQTGIAARNILHHGHPTAFDGRNAALCDNGRTLDTNLLFKQLPWFQYYVGAASTALFGNDTAGARALFAAAGMLAFFPLYAVLKPRLRHPAFIAALILLSPQTVLFQRNARYYPILILFYAVVLWLLSRDFRSRKWHTLATLLVFVLFFNTHPAAALGCAFALLLFCSLVRRQMFPVYLVAAGVGFLSWFVWYQLLAPALGDSGLYLPLIKLNPWRWLEGFFIATAAGVLDLDAVNLLPLLLWAGLLAILPWNRRAICVFKDPVAQFILLTLLVQAAANAAVFGCETMNSHSLLRYICYAAAFAMVPCFMMLDAIIRNRFIFAAASIFVVSFNLLTVSFWASPFPRKVPVSWLAPVYAEILKLPENSWDAAVAQLRSEPGNATSDDAVLAVSPGWCQESAIFYLGDRYLVPPEFNEMGTERTQVFRRAIGGQAFGLLRQKPEWILDFLDDFKAAPAGYVTAAVIPSHRARPDDGTRPELTRHTFPRPGVVRNVRLFHLQMQPR
ncbi:MAG: ArnT family glycosyltransferase [Limisphaerales bacterium]